MAKLREASQYNGKLKKELDLAKGQQTKTSNKLNTSSNRLQNENEELRGQLQNMSKQLENLTRRVNAQTAQVQPTQTLLKQQSSRESANKIQIEQPRKISARPPVDPR